MSDHQSQVKPFIIMTDPFINLATIQGQLASSVEPHYVPPAVHNIKIEHDNRPGMEQQHEASVPLFGWAPFEPNEAYQAVDASTLKPRFESLLQTLIEKPL